MTNKDQNTPESANLLKKIVMIILTLLFVLSIYLLSEAPMWALIHGPGRPQWVYDTYYFVYTPVDWFANTPIDPFLNKWWNLWVEPGRR